MAEEAELAAPPLWRATVPVFLSLLDRLAAMLDRAEAVLGEGLAAALMRRPAEGMFPAGQQLATAIQFTLRIAFPLAGRRAPELREPLDAADCARGSRRRRRCSPALDPGEFAGAEARVVRFQAGFADLELTGEDFLARFGLPNLHFHQAMAHVALKQAGVPLGKADFDGLHDYPEGFSFG
jgi:uncharacterized protein